MSDKVYPFGHPVMHMLRMGGHYMSDKVLLHGITFIIHLLEEICYNYKMCAICAVCAIKFVTR